MGQGIAKHFVGLSNHTKEDSMTYKAVAVIPIEISLSSIRVANFLRSDNDTRMVGNLDSLEKR